MSTQQPEVPSWRAKRAAAIHAWQAGLTAAEQIAAKEARDEARARSKGRQHGRVNLTERIATAHLVEGKTPDEIAAEFAWTLRNLQIRAAAFGIPMRSRANQRRLPEVWIPNDTHAALTQVGKEAGMTLTELITELLKRHGEDFGIKARREFRLPARPAPADRRAAG